MYWLVFADLLQVHLWLAVALGVLVRRRSRTTWLGIAVATAFYCTATSALSVLPFSPSAYLVTILGYAAAGWPRAGEISPVRVYALGVVSVFVLLCLVPTGVALLLSRLRRDGGRLPMSPRG